MSAAQGATDAEETVADRLSDAGYIECVEDEDGCFAWISAPLDAVLRIVEDAIAARDARVRAEAIAPVLALHRRCEFYELEDSCPDRSDEHCEEHHHLSSDGYGERYCDQLPVRVACEHCRDEDGEPIEWPCPTVRAVSIEQETRP